MTRPRSQLISLEATPYYHCISRCVRRAFLCGQDRYSGKSFNHRKPWILARLKLLEDVFAIDIAAYAIMSNHYHLVLHVNKARLQAWDTDTVIRQWLKLYKGPALAHDYLNGVQQSEAEKIQVRRFAETWRTRLCSISWFMACLNEYIARKANQEDECKGRFWEGRFISQALLDESALLSCMAYVDLNPVRAGISQDLRTSDYTSIQVRLNQVKSRGRNNSMKLAPVVPQLMPFREKQRQDDAYSGLPHNLKDYIDLVDWTGRAIRPDKRGSIPSKQPRLLTTLGLTDTQWQFLARDIQKQSITMFNGLDKLTVLENRKSKKVA